jgi:hypothetical protein
MEPTYREKLLPFLDAKFYPFLAQQRSLAVKEN